MFSSVLASSSLTIRRAFLWIESSNPRVVVLALIHDNDAYSINVCILMVRTGKRQKNCNWTAYLEGIHGETHFELIKRWNGETHFELIKRKTVFSLTERFSHNLKHASWNFWYQRVYLDGSDWQKTKKCNWTAYLEEIHGETHFELIKFKAVFSLTERFSHNLKHAN